MALREHRVECGGRMRMGCLRHLICLAARSALLRSICVLEEHASWRVVPGPGLWPVE
jgi:hypothetical protein